LSNGDDYNFPGASAPAWLSAYDQAEEIATLSWLSRSGAQPSQRQVADHSGLEPMYASKLARALEHAGLLTRTENPADPRAVQLAFTGRGTEVIVAAIAIVRELQEQILAPLGGAGSERSAALRDALQTLLHGAAPEQSAEE
jgi:MarR family transcriptional regulator, organic hydroperoxide resistance regulator